MLVFKMLELLVDDDYAKLSDFKGSFQSLSFRYDTQTSLYSYRGEVIDCNFFFLSCDYDGKQYAETVYNIDTDTEEQNPRKPNQIELKKQFFACYCERKRMLLLSDLEKKGTLKRILKERLGRNITIREVFTDMDAFANASKFLKTVSFVQRDAFLRNSLCRRL